MSRDYVVERCQQLLEAKAMNVLTISVEEWNAKNYDIATLRQRIAELEDPHYLKGLQNENEQLRQRLEAAHEHIEAADREVAKFQAEIATLTTLLKAASYHVEGDGEGGAALLVKIRAALGPSHDAR